MIGDFVREYGSGEGRRSNFYLFEPWDVGERPDWVLELMEQDGVKDRVAEYGSAPHLFQSGIIYERPRIGAIFAGTQIGKSYPVAMDIIMQATGELPHAMRYPKGVDTGIVRHISKENIIRFGRFDVDTGEFLDHDAEAEQDMSWNCGNVIGCGQYPKDKILKAGDEIWLGTYKQARDVNWWKTLKREIPEHLLDGTKGKNGFYESSQKGYVVYFSSGVVLRIITYEQGYERFESGWARRCVLDEEPPDERIFVAALNHCDYMSLVETPYRGMTYTFTRIRNSKDAGIRFYHCCQYDSPYRTREEVARKRKVMPKWEIDARVWGLHSRQVGKPYFHDMYGKLREWFGAFIDQGIRYTILSTVDHSPRDIVRERVVARVFEGGEWEVFEEPRSGCAYWLSADTARGDDGGDERVDANVAHVFRLPVDGERVEFPVEVASMRTVIDTKAFARMCLLGAAWYNNALVAVEAKGFSAGTFINEVHGYPHLYLMTVTDDRTKRQVERIGFDTNVKTRQMLFDELKEFIVLNEESETSPFKTRSTLAECITLVVGKGGRPDHPDDGTSDSLISFGIGLYVYRFDRIQIHDNSHERLAKKNVDMWADRLNKVSEKRPVLGSRRGLDARSKRH